MYVARIDDPQWLLEEAVRLHQPIYLATAHSYLPDNQGQHRPGLLMTYSITDYANDTKWSYQEIAYPTLGSQIDLRHTLYEWIRVNQPQGVAIVTAQRSGAV
jgi:hypothetical protein